MGVALSKLAVPVAEQAAHACVHCGSATTLESLVSVDGLYFCCNGCRFVYQLIVERGLDQFYSLREGTQPPVPTTVFERRNFDWLEVLCRETQGRLTIEVQGLACVACVWLIRRMFDGFEGAREIGVDLIQGTAELSVDAASFPAARFAQALQQLGYSIGPRSENAQAPHTRELVKRMGICGALALNGMLFATPTYCGLAAAEPFAPLFAKGAFFCATASMLFGASYFVRRALRALRMGFVHMELPIALGLVAAFGGSLYAWHLGDRRTVYFDFVSIFTFLMLVGRWLHQNALQKNRHRLLQAPLVVSKPVVGERFQVSSGGVIPVRSVLLSKEVLLGMEWINGEPESRGRYAGQSVPSGAINLSDSAVELEAGESWEESLLSKLVLPPAARPETEAAVQRFILSYLLVVLGIAGTSFAGWLLTGHGFQTALQVCISVLVVSCPCASGVALPLVSEIATSRVRARGVFVREPGLWGRLLKVRRIVFDKTGTLTADHLRLRSRSELDSLRPEANAALRTLVNRSMHPAATSLREALGMAAAGVEVPEGRVTEKAGFGIEWTEREGCVWRLGRASWALNAGENPQALESGKTVFSCNAQCLASFVFEESLRPDAVEEVEALKRCRLDIHILSGDDSKRVSRLASALQLPDACAQGGLTPEDKAAWLRAHGGAADTLMLGDGANDSLAFNEALTCGTPAVDRGVLEQRSDFYYLGRGLSGIRELLGIAKFKARVSRWVLGFTIAYNVFAVGLAVSGKMHPLLAAVLMPLSSLATLGIVAFAFRKGRQSER
jgi:Cu2+-exporting ATPase